MDASLVLKQEQVEAFHIVSNTYGKHKPTSALQIYSIYNSYGPRGGCFGELVDITTKTALANGCKPSFEARPCGIISNWLQNI
jgi:hypothetical protein